MRISVETEAHRVALDPKVGNVYPIRGGVGAANGHMMILFAITGSHSDKTGQKALFIVVDREGIPVGTTHYGMNNLIDFCPIAFVEGLDDLELRMRSL